MATKYIENQPKPRQQTMRENWEVMKPFVHFGFKVMMIVGGAVISIIKLVPELLAHKDNQAKKDDRIIKI
jgi:hypothetical protein